MISTRKAIRLAIERPLAGAGLKLDALTVDRPCGVMATISIVDASLNGNVFAVAKATLIAAGLTYSALTYRPDTALIHVRNLTNR